MTTKCKHEWWYAGGEFLNHFKFGLIKSYTYYCPKCEKLEMSRRRRKAVNAPWSDASEMKKGKV